MKILMLNGSPRRNGNTHAVLERMQKQLQEGNQVELLNICTMKLSGCVACEGCSRNGGHCVQHDDSDAVIQKIVQADAVIFGTPVYWWGMSSQLKMVVDKFYSQNGSFKTMKKKIGVLIVGANERKDPQYRSIGEQFDCIAKHLNWNMAFCESFSAYEPEEVLKQADLAQRVQQACDSLVK